jgi:hypothetical protein
VEVVVSMCVFLFPVLCKLLPSLMLFSTESSGTAGLFKLVGECHLCRCSVKDGRGASSCFSTFCPLSTSGTTRRVGALRVLARLQGELYAPSYFSLPFHRTDAALLAFASSSLSSASRSFSLLHFTTFLSNNGFLPPPPHRSSSLWRPAGLHRLLRPPHP